MMKCQLGQDLFTLSCQRKQNFAAIVRGAGAMHKASGLQAVHQFDGAMVADLHSGSQFANARPHPRRHTLDCQHQLILPALQAGLLHHLLAEVEEPADLETELRQRLIVRQSKLLHSADCIVPRPSRRSWYIVRRYKTKSKKAAPQLFSPAAVLCHTWTPET